MAMRDRRSPLGEGSYIWGYATQLYSSVLRQPH